MTKADIVTYLATLGYTKVVNVLPIEKLPISQADLFYTLQPVSIIDPLEETGNVIVYELRISYKTLDDAERDAKFANFVTVKTSLEGKGGLTFISNPSFKSIPDNRSVGTIQFYLFH